jgi:guanylate kinase
VTGARRGIPFVVAAPSGTGKTTVCRRVVDTDPLVEFSVSHTTRGRRQGEADGVDYHFVDREEFERLAAQGLFLEWAEYNGNLYGTSRRAIEEPLDRGHDVLLEIEVQGAAQVRERRGDARFVFLLPPSMKALEERLRARGTDSRSEIELRLAVALDELEAGSGFDYALVNDDLDRCAADLEAILREERQGRREALRRRFDPAAAVARLRPG